MPIIRPTGPSADVSGRLKKILSGVSCEDQDATSIGVAMGFESYFTATAALSTGSFERFAQHLDRDWIDEAPVVDGDATIRDGDCRWTRWSGWSWHGLMRDLPMTEILRQLDSRCQTARPHGSRRAPSPRRGSTRCRPARVVVHAYSGEWGTRAPRATGGAPRGLRD